MESCRLPSCVCRGYWRRVYFDELATIVLPLLFLRRHRTASPSWKEAITSLIGRDPYNQLHALVDVVIDLVSEMESQPLGEGERERKRTRLVMEGVRKFAPKIIAFDESPKKSGAELLAQRMLIPNTIYPKANVLAVESLQWLLKERETSTKSWDLGSTLLAPCTPSSSLVTELK
ncbi:hypothetical protein HAX54_020435, partial [Datura stramonium]|nr:hypothetical protein [Datura stramonium]